MCVYRFPTCEYGLDWYVDNLSQAYNSSTGTYKLTRNEMQKIYAHWRRCYAMGYMTSNTFATHSACHDMRIINPDKHLPFDIRLGYAVQMDYIVKGSIGTGDDLFTRRGRSKFDVEDDQNIENGSEV